MADSTPAARCGRSSMGTRDRLLRRLAQQGPLVCGIVNATPDSFSDGGRYVDPAAAIDHGLALIAQGGDLLDIGGESTRPGRRRQRLVAEGEVRRLLGNHHQVIQWVEVASVSLPERDTLRLLLRDKHHVPYRATAGT